MYTECKSLNMALGNKRQRGLRISTSSVGRDLKPLGVRVELEPQVPHLPRRRRTSGREKDLAGTDLNSMQL